MYKELTAHCDGVVVTSVNDCCVMSNWMDSMDIEHLEWFPDAFPRILERAGPGRHTTFVGSGLFAKD